MPIQNVVYQIDFDDSKAQAAFAKLRQNIAKANDDYEKFVKSSKKPTGDSVDKLADNLETADDKTRRAAKGLDLLAASLAGVQSETEDIDSKQIEELGNAADKTAEKIKKVGKAKKDAGLGKDDAGGSPKTEKLSKEEKELEKEANKKLEKEKKERTLDGKLSSFSQAANAGSDFKEALQAGDLKGAVESVKDFGGSLSALASPTGLAVAGAAAVVGALALTANAAAEGAKKIAEYKKQIGELSGIKGQDAENLAVNIAALSEVYGTDSEQYIKAVNTISQNRKITVQQADELLTQQVERGFSNEELKQLTEYDIQLKDFNFTTQQSINLIRNGKKFGFFDDKLPDAIKEAKIKILEFSTSAQDALKPLGDKFYNQLKLDLANKTKTGPELIQAIAKETQTQLKAGKIDKGQVQYIVTDVLGGSQGEDLGNSNTINFLIEKFNNYISIFNRLISN